jgi:hypothetical protein
MITGTGSRVRHNFQHRDELLTCRSRGGCNKLLISGFKDAAAGGGDLDAEPVVWILFRDRYESTEE